jgi:hypothetical protein
LSVLPIYKQTCDSTKESISFDHIFLSKRNNVVAVGLMQCNQNAN